MTKTFRFCALMLLFSALPVPAQSADTMDGSQEAQVESRSLNRERRFFATVEFPLRYKLFTPDEGKLQSTVLRERAVYDEGEVLVELKNDALYLDLLQRRANLLDAQQNLSKVRIASQHGQASKQELSRAEEQLAIAKAYLTMAEEKNAALTLRAPFKGRAIRVSAKLLKAREQNVVEFPKGDLLTEFVSDDALVLQGRLDLPASSLDASAYKAKVDDNGRLVDAEIISMMFMGPGRTEQYDIRLKPPTTVLEKAPLGTSMPAVLMLPEKYAPRSIPRAFVLSRGDLHYCLVKRNGELVEVSLMLGEYDARFIEVFGELEPGETVILPGSRR